MNYIIYDLEATCWEHKRPTYTQEIIEIGAVKMNQYIEVESLFSEFVKPVYHPTLSPFCKELTSIQQEDVEKAKEFPEVVENFIDWIGWNDDEEYLLCSWGHFDKKALRESCDLYNMENDWVDHHINLKQQFQKIKKAHRPIGLKRAVEKEGFEWTGQHHRGIDDAKNLARLFARYFDDWTLV